MTDRSNPVVAQLDADAENLLRCIDLLPTVERIMRDSLAEPGGHDFEVVASQTVLYCEAHQRDLCDCREAARRAEVEFGCTGVPVPVQADPTGDAAVHDRVWAEVRELRRRAGRLGDDVAWLVGFVERWNVNDRVPLRDPKAKDATQPLCEWHLRYGFEVPAEGCNPTRVRFRGRPLLRCPRHLCRWCGDDVRARFDRDGETRLATEGEILTHAYKTGLVRIVSEELRTA